MKSFLPIKLSDNLLITEIELKYMLDKGGKYWINFQNGVLEIWVNNEKRMSHWCIYRLKNENPIGYPNSPIEEKSIEKALGIIMEAEIHQTLHI